MVHLRRPTDDSGASAAGWPDGWLAGGRQTDRQTKAAAAAALRMRDPLFTALYSNFEARGPLALPRISLVGSRMLLKCEKNEGKVDAMTSHDDADTTAKVPKFSTSVSSWPISKVFFDRITRFICRI